MEVMIPVILEKVNNFPTWSVSCLEVSRSEIVAFWKKKSEKEQQELFWLKKYLIIMSLPFRVHFVDRSTKIYILLLDISKS